MLADEGDCVVQVVSAFSGESLCTLQLPRSSTVLQVKRRVQAAHGIGVFRQRLIISPAGPEVEGNEVLADLPGLILQLIRLEYVDDAADGVRHLLRAAGEGAAPEVELLLRLPLRPDCRQAEDGTTALMLASDNGHLEVVRLLCEAGADKDKAMHDGGTALIGASYNGHLDVARLLCEAGADKDKADQDGATALILATVNWHLEVVRLLCEAGADKDQAIHDGATALIWASRTGNLSLEVVRLLCEAGADKDKAKQDGETALIRASRMGNLEVVQVLCEAGADKDKADQQGATALIWASRWGHLKISRLLCEAGADKDKADQDGDTASSWASRIRRDDEVPFLLSEPRPKKMKQTRLVPWPQPR